MDRIRSFLSNDSAFGRLMNRLGLIIGANILFLLFSIPIVTIGASFCGMYTVCLRAVRDHGRGNVLVIRTFWGGFKENFKQATIAFLGIAALTAFLFLELSWCQQFAPPVSYFGIGIMALLVLVLILFIYIFPVIAAFRGTLRDQIRNTIYFAFSKPLSLLLTLFVHIFPIALTYSNLQFLPLAAFLWSFIGFGAIAMYCSSLHMRQFERFLQKVDAAGDPLSEEEANDPNLILQEHDESEEKTIREMRKFGL